MKSKSSAMMVAAALALCALPAAAQERGFYAGLSVGQSTANGACDGIGGAGVSCDDSSNTWKLFGGYQVNRHFAAELGYSDQLAKASASGPGGTAQVKVSAWELVAVPSYPITDQFSVYGKAGLYYATSKGTSSAGASASETDNGLTFGLGAGYQITKNVGARLEWQRYNDVGGPNIDALNLGVLYRF